MRNVLVTGGAGFIGSHLAESLVRRGDKVRVVDFLSTGNLTNLDPVRGEIEFVQGDLRDPAVVSQAVRGIDVVFHHAALASVPRSVEAPLETHAHCATATLMLLDEARRRGVQRFVFAASSSAYGNAPKAAKQETDLVEPLSPYAAAKLTGEMYCQSFYHSFGLETVCLRYFNVFGPRQDPASPYSAVIPLFIDALLTGRKPIIYGDGQQSRDFVYVSNVVDANLAAADLPTSAGTRIAGRSFNIGMGSSYSLLQLLAVLNRILGTHVEPEFHAARPGDVRDSQADISMARKMLRFEPRIGWEDGLERTIDYYRRQRTTGAVPDRKAH